MTKFLRVGFCYLKPSSEDPDLVVVSMSSGSRCRWWRCPQAGVRWRLKRLSLNHEGIGAWLSLWYFSIFSNCIYQCSLKYLVILEPFLNLNSSSQESAEKFSDAALGVVLGECVVPSLLRLSCPSRQDLQWSVEKRASKNSILFHKFYFFISKPT